LTSFAVLLTIYPMPTTTYQHSLSGKLPIRVGLIGTGYAAKLRAETLTADSRSQLVAVAGRTIAKAVEFSQTYQAEAIATWQELVAREDIDLVIVSNINSEHGAIARAALQAGKHVVVEYPLSLELKQAEELIAIATANHQLLHVEHIELLGSLHQALRQHLATIGKPFYARYSTITPQRPAPQRWTYHPDLFGFPFVGALSRIQRFTDLFGSVASVSCQARFWGSGEFYQTCICSLQLRFSSSLVAEVIYGKGENLWEEERKFTIQGEFGGLIFDGDQGILVTGSEQTPIDLGSRRGLFAKETAMVLDHLIDGTPLYVSAAASCYALKVADAARRSAETGETIFLN